MNAKQMVPMWEPASFEQCAGFKRSARTGKGKGWVVIYEAEAQGIDVGGDRYAVSCETHNTVVGAPTMRDALVVMRNPGNFCDDCRDPEGR